METPPPPSPSLAIENNKSIRGLGHLTASDQKKNTTGALWAGKTKGDIGAGRGWKGDVWNKIFLGYGGKGGDENNSLEFKKGNS